MALLARLGGVPALRYLAFVDVLMAIHATSADVFKYPLVVFEMAGETRGGHVRAFELESR